MSEGNGVYCKYHFFQKGSKGRKMFMAFRNNANYRIDHRVGYLEYHY